MTNIEIKLREMYDDLSATEKKVADYFLENMHNLFNLPIAYLAEESRVSQVAWVRFCKTLGYSGLKEMKKALFTEINESANDNQVKSDTYEFSDIANFSSISEICDTISASSTKAIEDSLKILDKSTINDVVNLLIKANAVKIFGVGASGLVGSDLYYKLIRIGKHAVFDRDVHVQLTYAATLKPNDAAIFISNSGITTEILDLLDVAKESNSKIITITRFNKNPLASSADYPLYISSPEADKRSGATCSRIAQLTLIDVLFTAIANKNYKNIEAALEKSHRSCNTHKQNNIV